MWPKSPALSILDMQQAILAAGYQFVERVFNDGKRHNCMIDFTLCKDPMYFHSFEDRVACRKESGHDDIGWGRFERQDAWQQAYNWIVLGQRD